MNDQAIEVKWMFIFAQREIFLSWWGWLCGPKTERCAVRVGESAGETFSQYTQIVITLVTIDTNSDNISDTRHK